MLVEIRNAQTILVPDGERYHAIAAAASEEFGFDFPTFPDNEMSTEFDGRVYKRANDADIPELISKGGAHIGFAGIDSCTEAEVAVAFRSFGQPFAYFELLVPASLASQALGRLTMGNESLGVRTRYPKLLVSGAQRRGVRLVPVNEGSDLQVFADVTPINTGTAEGMTSILRLREIRPAIVLPKIVRF